MTRFLVICLAGSVLGGCAMGTAIDTSRVRDECIQHAYSRNFWLFFALPLLGVRPFRGRGFLPEHEYHRITDVAKQGEGDQPDREHDERALEQAPDHEGEHGRGTRRRAIRSRALPYAVRPAISV